MTHSSQVSGLPVDRCSDQAQHYDGNISIPGCDKNMPGCFMAAVRHNRPTIIIYGGTIQPGVRHIGMLVTRYEHPMNLSESLTAII